MKTYQNIACVAPFSSLHISTKSYPCCVINPNRGIEFDDSLTITELFDKTNGKLQTEFLNFGTDFKSYVDCTNCNSRTDVSQHFDHNRKALPDIDYIQNPTLTYLHIKFSNKCNLACRTCDIFNSSMFYKEQGEEYPNFGKLGINQTISRDSVLYKSMLDNLENIKFLWFSGGEPLLHDEVWEIIELLYNKNLTRNIYFQTNTNGTIKLSPERIKMLNSFKEIEIHISMDGIGKHAEYIRTGIIWDRWLENLRYYKQELNSELYITTTISAYNIHIADQIIEFFENEKLNIIINYVFNPKELCVKNMGDAAKNYINEKFKSNTNRKIAGLLGFINQNPSTKTSNEIITYIDNKDNNVIQRNLYKNYIPFRELDPEWYNILKL